jgi:hypothetical protein
MMGGLEMKKKDLCVWYNETSGVKRAYDLGLIDRKWVENYCWNGGKGCVRKKRFEQEGYVSPDYVLPDGTISERVKEYLERKGRLS